MSDLIFSFPGQLEKAGNRSEDPFSGFCVRSEEIHADRQAHADEHRREQADEE